MFKYVKIFRDSAQLKIDFKLLPNLIFGLNLSSLNEGLQNFNARMFEVWEEMRICSVLNLSVG